MKCEVFGCDNLSLEMLLGELLNALVCNEGGGQRAVGHAIGYGLGVRSRSECGQSHGHERD